jgi:restriction endonuclease S subunit
MYPLHVRRGFAPEYVLAFLTSEVFTLQATAQQARTGIPKVNREQLGGFLIPKPPTAEQTAIGTLINRIDVRFIDAVLAHRTRAKIFEASLAQLMTGRIRIKSSAHSLESSND